MYVIISFLYILQTPTFRTATVCEIRITCCDQWIFNTIINRWLIYMFSTFICIFRQTMINRRRFRCPSHLRWHRYYSHISFSPSRYSIDNNFSLYLFQVETSNSNNNNSYKTLFVLYWLSSVQFFGI